MITEIQAALIKLFDAELSHLADSDYNYEPAREKCKLITRSYFAACSDSYLFSLDAIDITFHSIESVANGHYTDRIVETLLYGNLYSFVLSCGEFVPYYHWISDDFYKGKRGIYYRAMSGGEKFLFTPNDENKEQEMSLMA